MAFVVNLAWPLNGQSDVNPSGLVGSFHVTSDPLDSNQWNQAKLYADSGSGFVLESVLNGPKSQGSYSMGIFSIPYNTECSWYVEVDGISSTTWTFTTKKRPAAPAILTRPPYDDYWVTYDSPGNIEWQESPDADHYEVWFAEVGDDLVKLDDTTDLSYPIPSPLIADTYYNIRIVVVPDPEGDTDGENVNSNASIFAAMSSLSINPDPSDGSTISYATRYLMWSNGGGFNVRLFFGTNSPPTNILNNVSTSPYGDAYDLLDVLPLEEDTTYYWRIDIDGVTGTEWSFTTTSNTLSEDYSEHEKNVSGDTTFYDFNFTANFAKMIAQTFTPQESHTIKGVRLKLGRELAIPAGNIKIYLRAVTEDGLPGEELTSATYDGRRLPASGVTFYSFDMVYEDIYINFDTPVSVEADTKYVITIESENFTVEYPGYFWTQDSYDSDEDAYVGGNELDYSETVAEWSDFAGDLFFSEYAGGPPKAINPTPADASRNIPLSVNKLTWEAGV